MPTKKKPAAEKTAPVVAYKGFNAQLRCRDFQYEVGQTYRHDGPVEACVSGFHSCENPLDVWSYYGPGESRFAEVEVSGEIARHDDDSKIASAEITIRAELTLPQFIERGVKWVLDHVDWAYAKESNTGYQSAATNTGDRSAATNTGYQSAATNTGYQSAATNTGDQSAATNTGYQSAATNTGDQSAATNTGDQSAATNTGDRSAATNTGYQSAATNTGDQSAATNTGDQSAATVSGKHAVAISLGYEGVAMAAESGAICLVCRDSYTGKILAIRASKVGENGIEPNVAYRLTADGAFVKAE